MQVGRARGRRLVSAAARRLCLDTRLPPPPLPLLLLLMSAAMEYGLRQTVCRSADVTGGSAALQQQVRAVLLTNRCIDHGVCAGPGRSGLGWVGLDHPASRADVMLHLALLVGRGKRGRLPALCECSRD